MEKYPTEVLLDQLIKNLLQDFLFYVPSNVIPSSVLKELRETDVKDLLDNYLVADIEFGLYEYEFELFNEKLLNKHRLFEKNLFLIMKANEYLSNDELNLLLIKYFEQFEFYGSVSGWFLQEFSSFKKHEEFAQIKAAFQMQSQYFKKHLIEFVKRFLSGQELQIKEQITREEIIEYYLPDLLARFGSANSIEKQPTEVNVQSEIPLKTVSSDYKKSAKEKQKPLITPELSDAFILESVFNLKISNR